MQERLRGKEVQSAATTVSAKSSGGRSTVSNDLQALGGARPRPGSSMSVRHLSHASVLSMQRLAGNRATSSMLKPLAVQRFPQTALSAPVKWSVPPPQVFRPGEGLSGGVYILTSTEPDPAIPKVVVKPVYTGTQYGETGETLQFGDRLLGMLGVNTPVSRIIQVGTPEFSELVSVIRPYQPAPRQFTSGEQMRQEEEAGRGYLDLSQAQSLVVMSEVPKARSAQSFAEKAGTDEQAKNDLFGAMFSDTIVEQLARLAVGDLLLGNPDRLTTGGMNLGNLMISIQEGKASIHAIDTGVVLPKEQSPREIIESGGYGSFVSTKKHMADPTGVADGFYTTMIRRIQEASPAPVNGGAPPAWQAFQEAYEQRRVRIMTTFKTSWDWTLFNIFNLLRDQDERRRLKSLTGEYKGKPGEEKMSHSRLKANAMYLAGWSEGKTHEQSAAVAAAYLAYKQLTELDTGLLRQAGSGDVRPWAAGRPSASVFSANLTAMPGLPTFIEVTKVGQAGRWAYFDQPGFDRTRVRVEMARRDVEQLGAKERKGRDVTRNRVQAGNYIANVYLESIGSRRTLYRFHQALRAVQNLGMAGGGELRRDQRNRAAAVGDVVLGLRVQLARSLDDYAESITSAATEVRRIKKYRGRQDLQDNLAGLGRTLREESARINGEIDAQDPVALIEALRG